MNERSDRDVVDDAEPAERAHDLVRAGDPGARDTMRRPTDDRASGEAHLARVGPQDAADHVEQGRLAGAVRTDQREDLTVAHLERHVAERLHAAERDGHVLYGQQKFAHPPRLRANRAAIAGTMPRGSAISRATSRPPKIIR